MITNWKNSKRKPVKICEIISILKKVSEQKNHKIIIGSDSVKSANEFIFANAICIINDNNFYDRRFFYSRKKVLDSSYRNISNRLLKETTESIEIANMIKKEINNINIEIHADVNFDSQFKSYKLKNTITGYVNGCGFKCIIKPDSFVASGIADLFTRKK